MARYNEKRLPYSVQERMLEMLANIMARLETPEDIRDFLKDLLNRQERAMLARRLLIAEKLIDGYTYREIVDELKCGTTTIARVERWVHFGRDGYRKAIGKKK